MTRDEIIELMARTAEPILYGDGDATFDADVREAQAEIIDALEAAGLKVLGREPSEKMAREGADYLPITPGGATNKSAAMVFEAMWDAA